MEAKASAMFGDPFDHSFNDLFNEYVNMDTSSPNDSKDLSLANDFDQIFPLDPISNGCGDRSPYIPTSKQSAPPLCSKEAWCLQQDAVSSACPRGFVLPDPPQSAAIPDLTPKQDAQPPPAGVHRPLSTSLSTPPTTPRKRKGAKGVKTTPKPIHHRASSDHLGLRRKQSFSPSLTDSSQMQKNRMAYSDTWNSRIQNFNFQPSNDRLPLSPPPSDILVQHENMPTDSATQMNHSGNGIQGDSATVPVTYEPSSFSQPPPVSMPSPSSEALARQQQRYLTHFNNTALPNQRPASPDAIYSSSSSDRQSMSSWQSSSIGASAFSFPSDLQSHDTRAWWSPTASRMPEQQNSYQSVVGSSGPGSPFQDVHAAGGHGDMMQGGLMIQFEPSLGAPTTAEPSFSPSNMPSAHASQEDLHFSSPEANAGPHRFVDASSFTTPLVHDPNPPRSPSLSPNTSPKSAKSHRRNHSRKLSSLSMNSPKPATGSSRSSTSPKGHGKSPSVSFVNFTGADSRKILGGVAPSGSSKTKARREQEARDRRRKLSQAALDAVRSAGGDVEALEAVLC